MNVNNIAISVEVDGQTSKTVADGLNSFNELHNGPDPTKPLWVVSRDGNGDITGGLQGFVQWDWFVIGMLWVREELRGQGIGSELLAEAEKAARQRGCTRSWLATMTFQAPEFYKRYGYVEVCRMPDMPPGHSYLWMAKTLSA